MVYNIWYEPCREKTCFRDFQPGQTQIVLYNHKRWLGLKFCMFEVKGLYYLCSTNKGADQLHRAADLQICFRICKKQISHDAAHI